MRKRSRSIRNPSRHRFYWSPASATPRDPSLATNYRGSGLVHRRVLPVAAHARDRLLSDPRAGPQCRRKEPVFMPLLRRSQLGTPSAGSGGPSRNSWTGSQTVSLTHSVSRLRACRRIGAGRKFSCGYGITSSIEKCNAAPVFQCSWISVAWRDSCQLHRQQR